MRNKVDSFKTKHKEGFTLDEYEKLISHFSLRQRERFYDALNGCTGLLLKGVPIIYHGDVEKAYRCAVENRELKSWEWD